LCLAYRNPSHKRDDLVRRGLGGACVEILCLDGGAGPLAALPTAFPEIPVQRCWAHEGRGPPAR
jgi:transposase-like protein